MRFAELDAVTVDAFGTLVSLADPVPALDRLLRSYGLERSADEIEAAFHAEGNYYRPRSLRGRDAASLAALREECAGVFLDALGAVSPGDDFAQGYVSALQFEAIPGVEQVLARLRGRGLDLAVVSNWDVGLGDHLSALGLSDYFSHVVTSAEAGVAKPDPAIFEVALERLAVSSARAAHVGDGPADAQGAAATGMRFVPAPLATAFRDWA